MKDYYKVSDEDDLDENESEIFSGLGPNAHLSGAKWYHSTSAPLHRRLIERMRRKNSSVKKMITRNDSLDVDLDSVMTTPWETEFKPLTYDDIFMAWKGLCEEDEIFSKCRSDVKNCNIHFWNFVTRVRLLTQMSNKECLSVCFQSVLPKCSSVIKQHPLFRNFRTPSISN